MKEDMGDVRHMASSMDADVEPTTPELRVHRRLSDLESSMDPETTAKLLMNLARNPDEIAVVQAGSITRIINAMQRHLDLAVVQECGCEALWKLAFNNTNNQVSIAKAGGIVVVINAMQQHSDHAVLQECGCLALSSLAGSNTDNQVAIAEAGGISCVTNAMQQHSDHACVQHFGCLTLSTLAGDNADNQVAIAKARGITCVINAMQQYPYHAGVQECGCGAASTLANNSADNQVAIAKAGGITCVTDAMQQHSYHVGVQEYGCWALGRLAANNADNEVAIAKAGGITRVINAMQQHSEHTDVEKNGCEVLYYLSCAVRNHTILLQSRVTEVLNAAKLNFPLQNSIQLHSQKVLENLNLPTNVTGLGDSDLGVESEKADRTSKWSVSKLSVVPKFYHTSKTARFVAQVKPSDLGIRICAALQQLSIQTTFDNDEAEAACTCIDGTSFWICLFQGAHEYDHGVIVDVVLQLKGIHDFTFFRSANAILRAAAGESFKTDLHEGVVFTLYPKVVKQAEEADDSGAADLVSKIIGDLQLRTTSWDAFETLVRATDPGSTNEEYTVSVSRAIVSESRATHYLLDLVREALDARDSMEDTYDSLCAMTVLANTLNNLGGHVSMKFQGKLHPMLVRFLKDWRDHLQLVYQAVRCVAALLSTEGSTYLSLWQGIGLREALLQLQVLGDSSHAALERVAKLCLESLETNEKRELRAKETTEFCQALLRIIVSTYPPYLELDISS